MSTAPVFLVDALPESDKTVLDGDEGRHAATVRRLGAGAEVQLSDGVGGLAECSVIAAGEGRLELAVVGRRRLDPPQPRLIVVQALPKGDRGELAVELMTELGVDVIVPWAAARCVMQWRGDRGEKSLRKWRSSARAAAKQSRRAWVPEVSDPASTRQVCSMISAARAGVVLHESARRPLPALDFPGNGDVVLVVGPEGGLTEGEVTAFRAAGARTARLGPTVLRTSTAGAAALAVLGPITARWS
ncbi:MAG TPA: 16S rRNA (uracil(1498)-N(3))-methyltransferase [Mycobacteriales bacterium]|nr:16S rRNA (uracil(1498)-N(3))-methyltransferase [Mycobacteriales bacterium]